MFVGLRSRISRIRYLSQLSLVSWLRLAWIATLIWCEFGSFYFSLSGCSWPDKALKSSGEIAHVLLVTDPQVRHAPRSQRWIDQWRHAAFHRTIQKNWKHAYGLSPDVVIFLGDMLAHGHHLDDDDEYTQYVQRFRGLLPVNTFVPTYYAPGNEDVGLRINVKAARAVRRRFVDNFGPLNQHFSMFGHDFIILDAPGLVEEDYHRTEQGLNFANLTASPGGAMQFLQQLPNHLTNQPRILLTHIPLARPELASCGPLRERGSIRRGVGAGYQNTLGKRTTRFLLNDIHPAVIFSGDDRDYCDYTHRMPGSDPSVSDGIREVTVKSFSPFRSLRHPGFHLLSLVDPLYTPRLESPTVADKACFLPDHRDVYTSCYLPLAIITLVVLLISQQRSKRQQAIRLPSYHTLSPTTDVDEDSERRPGIRGGKKWEWSPQSALLTKQSSMYESLPTLRAPHSPIESKNTLGNVEPILRATLHSSPPLLPDFLSHTPDDHYGDMTHVDLQKLPAYPHEEEDLERDPMCPAPYTPRSFPSRSSSTSSPSSQDGCALDLSTPWLTTDTPTSYFRTATAARRKRWWKWSWSFVLRGRRRRMTISIPVVWRMVEFGSAESRRASLSAFREADWAEKFGLTAAVLDYWHVCWPATTVWLVLFYRELP
ncbi:hypothetical protein EIP91_006058 [Steccherinum ochraceum]|uniref:Calcineurin-like phosphoesterase domain-containing protein n=1 Tax=Steccherinum ochraceum TaxID=92696 RepID=A0A4R0RC73_9APHY|nr:hypothetical protein EIP91_006058 [Steccherinum ochraceum]